MSHHFDTPTAKEDPRINLCDFYLFSGRPGTTVMAMTVNPNAGVSSPDTFREEGLYAFRFDLDNDAHEEVTFKIQFGSVLHDESAGHQHIQKFEVRRAIGTEAQVGAVGDLIAAGATNSVVTTPQGVSVFAGVAPELFAGDAAALGAFRKAFDEGKFFPDAFQSKKNFFAGHNVTAIVLEVPDNLIGQGRVHSWATVSLVGHAPEEQVSRWGVPLLTHIFMPDMAVREDYNSSPPSDDITHFSAQFESIVEKLTTLAGSAAEPAMYARQLVERVFPTTLPYELGSVASFEVAKFNGRALSDDAMDVILSLATNTSLQDGVAPDRDRIIQEFPYFGSPYVHTILPV